VKNEVYSLTQTINNTNIGNVTKRYHKISIQHNWCRQVHGGNGLTINVN